MTSVLIHFGLDILGGLSLRCAMGLCKHKSHQYIVWGVMGLFISYVTVQIVG